MKRHLNHLLLHTRGRLESAHATRRTTTPRNNTTAAIGSLQAEDGYDWLRQIKPTRQAHRQTGR